MGAYSVGIETKNKIINESIRLFYETGYIATSCKMICQDADINPGLLPYHFKSKSNIAKEIYFNFVRNHRAACEEAFGDCKERVVFNFASLMLFYDLILSDSHLRQFWYDIAISNILADPVFWEGEVFLRDIIDSYSLPISEEELYTIYCIQNGMEIELTKNICKGLIKEPLSQVFQKQHYVTLTLLGFSQSKAHDILSEANQLKSQYRIKRLGYFDVAYEK